MFREAEVGSFIHLYHVRYARCVGTGVWCTWRPWEYGCRIIAYFQVQSLHYGRPPYLSVQWEVRGQVHAGAEQRLSAAVWSLRDACNPLQIVRTSLWRLQYSEKGLGKRQVD